jgi:hypothetical protein
MAPVAERPIVLPRQKREPDMVPYLAANPEAFDPESIRLLSGALDDAWRVVQANESKFKINGNAEGARDLLAKHIIDMAKQGELDRQRLIEGALARLKL